MGTASVRAMAVALTIAKVLAKASGWKSFPSCPVSANTGTNARMIIAIEKNVGRPTSFVARKTVSKTRPRLLVSTPSRCLNAFSVTDYPPRRLALQ